MPFQYTNFLCLLYTQKLLQRLIDKRRAAFLRVYVLLVYSIRTGKMDDIVLRVSDHVLEVIFSYLDLHTLRNCSLVCKRWNRFLNDENNDAWRMHCIRKLAQEALSSDLLSSVPTYKSKLRAFYHAWNPNDCSRNVYIRPNGFTMHRQNLGFCHHRVLIRDLCSDLDLDLKFPHTTLNPVISLIVILKLHLYILTPKINETHENLQQVFLIKMNFLKMRS